MVRFRYSDVWKSTLLECKQCGKRRLKTMTKEKRRRVTAKAARARWKKPR